MRFPRILRAGRLMKDKHRRSRFAVELSRRPGHHSSMTDLIATFGAGVTLVGGGTLEAGDLRHALTLAPHLMRPMAAATGFWPKARCPRR